MANPPVLWEIDSDPVLAGTKIIAEAWDAAGLYQVGHFIGDNWKEWNGRFRDDVRSFVRGDAETLSRVADRLVGSPAIYGHERREAEQSVNFVTCHDGFTLNDLVSYNYKHNDANGENNRDGSNDNCSWNCGVEGPTDNADVKALRKRQMKNFFTINMLSLGVPMMLMGDEAGHSQGGNNNTYCQDNELSWFDWDLLKENAELHRFVSLLNSRRVLRDVGPELARLNLIELVEHSQIVWHGTKLYEQDWAGYSHALALNARNSAERFVFHWILNAYWEPLTFELPVLSRPWRRWIDTGLNSPEDIVDVGSSPLVSGFSYRAEARSTVVLYSDTE
jgi:glycogen operon protein